VLSFVQSLHDLNAMARLARYVIPGQPQHIIQRGNNRQVIFAADDLSAIRECTHKGWALGGERFREQVEALTQRRAASKGVGRPRKEKNRVRPS
jgi:hypothetical protein